VSEPIDQLRTDPPRTGRLIREDGAVVNEADAFDTINKSRVSMTDLHANTHKGIVFDLSQKIELSASQILYFVGITKENIVHFNRHGFSSSEGGVEFRLLEDVTYTAGTGALLSGQNRNRGLDKLSTLEIHVGGNVTDDGTELHLLGLPQPASGTPTRQAQSALDAEWVLKANSVYAIKIINTTAVAKTVYAEMTWYEPGLLN